MKAPGKTAREFIEGSRVNHYKPILMVFVVTGISTFLTATFLRPGEMAELYYLENGIKPGFDIKALTSELMKYTSLIYLLTIPLMSIFTWWVFRKWGYNYYENIIYNAYFLVLWLVATILLVFPLQLLLRDNYNLFIILPTLLSYALALILVFWFFIGFYDQKAPGDVILKVLLLFAVLTVAFLVLTVGSGIIAGIYMSMNGIKPEDIFLPK